ncbi:transposase domain-containing protein [Burkholderia sp. BE17]|uniref:transposase domain-containing protein n=1 Tax=Burkholderia sp. BE17 TaxID=2656644 RepID=UPI0039EEC9C7
MGQPSYRAACSARPCRIGTGSGSLRRERRSAISNNLCENAIRPFVVRLFADTVAGAHASANLYSLVEPCKANDIDPYRYLTWLFQRLPLAQTAGDYTAPLPWNMPT